MPINILLYGKNQLIKTNLNYKKINSLVKNINEKYNCIILKNEDICKVNLLNDILILLINFKIFTNIEFVYDKGKIKTEIQKLTEMTNDYLEKQIKYDTYNSTFDVRNSFSKADTDATFMHMKEYHLRNDKKVLYSTTGSESIDAAIKL